LVLFRRGWPATFDAADRRARLKKTVVVALLRFESGAQEVFAATVLPGRGYPELIDDDGSSLKE
jgi:hypothetical protein